MPPIDAKRASRLRFESLKLFLSRGTTEANLSPLAVLTWLCLWAYVREDGLVSMSHSRIAQETRLSLRSVTKAIGELKKKRMLAVKVRGTVRGTPNTYVLSPTPRPPKSTP